MRKLGLIGGLSWVATESYYRYINTAVQKRTNGTCNPPLVIESVNFCDLAGLADDSADWGRAADDLGAAAKRLEAAGATAILICANSMHRIYDDIQATVSIPILHIIDPVGAKMKADGVKSAALVGTRNVMTGRWFRQRLVSHGITLIPADPDRAAEIDRIVYQELMHGKVTRDAERTLKTYFTNYEKADVDAIVLACTELDLVVDTKANVLPIYDTTELHARAGVDWIMGDAP